MYSRVPTDTSRASLLIKTVLVASERGLSSICRVSTCAEMKRVHRCPPPDLGRKTDRLWGLALTCHYTQLIEALVEPPEEGYTSVHNRINYGEKGGGGGVY